MRINVIVNAHRLHTHVISNVIIAHNIAPNVQTEPIAHNAKVNIIYTKQV